MSLYEHKTNRWLIISPYLVLFIISLTYFAGFTRYIFFCQEKSSLFLFSIDFLLEHIERPGGFLYYSGKFFTSFFYVEILGSVFISLIILFTVYITALIGKTILGKQVYIIPIIQGALLILLHTHYYYAVFNTLGILFQVVLFYYTIHFLKDRWKFLPVVLFPGWYFLTGGFAWIFLIQLSSFFILKRKKGWLLKLLTMFSLSLLFFIVSKEYLFYEPIKKLLLFPFSYQDIGKQTDLFYLLIFLNAGLPLFFEIKVRVSTKNRNKKIFWIFLSPFVIIVILTALLVIRFDTKNIHYFHVEKLFYKNEYNKIINYNSRHPSTNRLTLFLNNIALTETGKLTERLFNFPQSPDGKTLFLKYEIINEILKRGGYFYYTIGMVNEAHRWAYEYMVLRGYTPEGLKMLIKTELINGNHKMAEKYVSLLKQTIFYREETKNFEKFLYNDKIINADPELGQKKQLKPQNDFFAISENPIFNITTIVNADSVNVPALEYYFAWLLLQKDIKSVVEFLPLLEKAGYHHIPKHIEEAAIAFKLLESGKFPELDYLQISDITEKRFRLFYQILHQNINNTQHAERMLQRNFSDTFWYYLFFK